MKELSMNEQREAMKRQLMVNISEFLEQQGLLSQEEKDRVKVAVNCEGRRKRENSRRSSVTEL